MKTVEQLNNEMKRAEREYREAESRMIKARQAYYAATAGMSSIERVFGKKWASND